MEKRKADLAKRKREMEAKSAEQRLERAGVKRLADQASWLPSVLASGEEFERMYEGTLGWRYVLTDRRVIAATTNGSVEWTLPYGQITAMDLRHLGRPSPDIRQAPHEDRPDA